MKKILLQAFLINTLVFSWANGQQSRQIYFSPEDIHNWRPKIFAGETLYTLEKTGPRFALRANSNASASGRYHEIKIDLTETPVVNWTWKVANILPAINERSRDGDDYAARVYVVFSGGLAFWRTRAINYVWSSNQPLGSSWPNAYTDNVQMIAVESGAAHVGKWRHEQRNIRMDYRRMFGEDVRYIDAIAIMTDTDNSGATATAWYGGIWFTPENVKDDAKSAE